jgi:hypothetical protein
MTTTPMKAIHKTLSTGKLDLKGVDIPCAVIEGPDKKPIRVLSRRQFQACIGMTRTAVLADDPVTGLPPFLTHENLKPSIPRNLEELLAPLWYKEPRRGLLASGYRAELLPAVCKIYTMTFRQKSLLPEQEAIFLRCLEIQEAFANLGIIALVDEATGYQEQRERDELQKLITLYLLDVPGPWQTTFSHEYYQEAYRLHKLKYQAGQTSHPPIIGAFTKRAIYDWLPPGVYEELCRRNPRVPSEHGSRRIRKHHQHLTKDIGREQIIAQLRIVLYLMRASGSLERFWTLLESGRPYSQVVMPFYLADTTRIVDAEEE